MRAWASPVRARAAPVDPRLRIGRSVGSIGVSLWLVLATVGACSYDAHLGSTDTPDTDAFDGALGPADGSSRTDTGGEPTDAGPAALTLDEFIARYRTTVCERYVRCDMREVNAWWSAAPELACEQIYRANYPGAFSGPYLVTHADELARGAERGTLVFDPATGERCLAGLATSCTSDQRGGPRPFPFDIGACDGAITGTVAVGAPCSSLVECAPGAFCSRDDALPTCAGVCTARPPEGATCADNCEICDRDRCTYRNERAVRGSGEPCGFEFPGGGRTVRAECGPNLYCAERCFPYLAEGEACEPGYLPQCAAPLVCAAGRCARAVVQTTEGAPCDDAGTLCDRFHRLICEDGACVRIGGGEGARCVEPFSELDCDAPTRCDDWSHLCFTPLPDGAGCGDGVYCASLGCVDGQCAPPRCAP